MYVNRFDVNEPVSVVGAGTGSVVVAAGVVAGGTVSEAVSVAVSAAGVVAGVSTAWSALKFLKRCSASQIGFGSGCVAWL